MSFALNHLLKSALLGRGEARAIAKQFPSMPHQWSDLENTQKKELRQDLRTVLKKYPTVHTGDVDRLARYGVRVAGPAFGMGLIDPTGGLLMGGTVAWQMKRREQLKALLRQELKGRKITEE
jgi:hypothetical protein